MWSRSQQKQIKSLIYRKSSFYDRGDAAFWILTNFRGQTIGRIAAFVEHPEHTDHPQGFIGLLDCINHFKAAASLFDESKHWLAQQGVKSMKAPLSFLPFQLPGVALHDELRQGVPFLSTQASYFADLYEFYGFKPIATDELWKYESVNDVLKEEVKVSANHTLLNRKFTFKRINKAELESVAEAIATIYTSQPEVLDLSAQSSKVILHWLRLMFDQSPAPLGWIVYRNGEPFAFTLNIFVKGRVDQPSEVLWKQWIAHFSKKNQFILNLGHQLAGQGEEAREVASALLFLCEQEVSEHSQYEHQHFLILKKSFTPFKSCINTTTALDKFAKFEYSFDQEPLIGTFAKSKIVARN